MDKPAERSVVKPVGGPGKVRGKEEAEGFLQDTSKFLRRVHCRDIIVAMRKTRDIVIRIGGDPMEGKNKGGILLVEDDRSLNRAVSLKLAKEG